MGAEYYGMPPLFLYILELANLVLTCGFGLEMVMKLIAYGLLVYWSNPFNCLDGFIVIISVLEFMLN